MKFNYYLTLLLALMFVCLIHNPSQATTYYVHPDSTYTTIQSVLNICGTDDIIFVGPSTYNERLVWSDVKGIKLIGAGAESTIIDGGGLGTVIEIDTYGHSFTSIIDTSTHIEGFTIRNGDNIYSGGIFLNDASPTISNNIITNNTAENQGAGIYCAYSDYALANPSIVISKNTIINNTAGANGGGIYLANGGDTTFIFISDNIISRNTGMDGGGIYFINCDNMTINDNIIKYNYSSTCAGGVSCNNSDSLLISNNAIIGNNALSSGGGIDLYYTSPTIINNIFIDNSTDGRGGAIHCWIHSNPLIRNNTIINNSGDADESGGIHIWYDTCTPILGGSADCSNNIYRNSPYNFYKEHNIGVIATYNYWGNFSLSEIQETLGGETTFIVYTPVVDEPVPVVWNANSDSDTLYFAELTLNVTSITGEGDISVSTYIDTAFPVKSSYIVDKFWEVSVDSNITDFTGELILHYIDDELELYDGWLDCVRYDTTNGCFTCLPAIEDTIENTLTCTISNFTKLEGIWLIMNHTSVDEDLSLEIIDTYKLEQNYPNPFNPQTTIKYQLPETNTVKLYVYNSIGQLVKTLVDDTQEAGIYNIAWDGKDNNNNEIASGIYIYRLMAGDYIETRKMLLLK